MPADFWFLSSKPQIWAPISLDRANRDYRYLTVVGRRRSPRPQTAADLAALANAMGQDYPGSNQGWKIEIDDLRDWLANRSFRTRILLLAGALILVLLIACANAASLLL